MNVDKELRRLAKAEKAIAARDRKLAAMQDEQVQARGASDAAKERLALTMLRQRGVFDLSAGQLMALLSGVTPAVAMVHGAIVTSAPPVHAEENGGVETSAVPGSVDVAVKISRNAAEAKRDLLSRAGLKWNGKAGQWIGTVDRSRVSELQAVFGERVAIKFAPEHEAPVVTPAPAEPVVVPDAAGASEALPEARQAVSEANAGISGGDAGEAVRDDTPAVSGGPAAGALPPVRPLTPVRPVPPRPAH
jgi:hypothetical protein